MAQIFHPSFNTIAKATIFGGLVVIAAVTVLAAEVFRSPYVTEQHVAREQPVPFSHEHHVDGLGIDCRYCHTSVEVSNNAGLPNTKTCMTCHSQIWTNAQLLEPVRQSWRTNTPIRWTRVNDLPDFAHFNHSSHVQKGVGCTECHGPVNKMPLMWQAASLQMEWCLNCHRNPERYVRDRSLVFDMNYQHPSDQLEVGRQLVEKYNINKSQLTNCSICHY
jgi:hypothetical protein